jgi:hypothetical protein
MQIKDKEKQQQGGVSIIRWSQRSALAGRQIADGICELVIT